MSKSFATLSLVLCAGLAAAGVCRAGPPDNFWRSGRAGGDNRHGAAIAASQCAGCHGQDGNASQAQIPKLAGQRRNYLYRQLLFFQRGDRRSEVMAPIAAGLSPAAMRDLATYYAQLPAVPDTGVDKAAAARGRLVFLEGRGVAGGQPCAQCHLPGGQQAPGPMVAGSMMGGGMMGGGMHGSTAASTMMQPGMIAGTPRLEGQHAAYLLDQLNRYAIGARPWSAMHQVASGLSPADRQAVAAYLSTQP